MSTPSPSHINLHALRSDRRMQWKYTALGDTATYTPWHDNDPRGHTWLNGPVSLRTTNEHLSVLLVGKDRCIYHSGFDLNDTGDYSPWAKVGGRIVAMPALANNQAEVHIFYIGEDGTLFHRLWDGPTNKPKGEKFIDVERDFIPNVSPTAVHGGNGEIFVFALRKGGDLAWMSWSPERGWNKSQTIASNWSSSLKVVSDATGNWRIFGLDINNNVRHIAFSQGKLLEETFKVQATFVEAVDAGNGKTHMFVGSVDRQVFHRVYVSDEGWKTWENLGGIMVERARAVSHSPGSIALFGLGSDRSLWGIVHSKANNKWSGWFGLGDDLIENVG